MTTLPSALPPPYLQRLLLILDKIEVLRPLAGDYFGQVGNLGRVDQALDDLLAITQLAHRRFGSFFAPPRP